MKRICDKEMKSQEKKPATAVMFRSQSKAFWPPTETFMYARAPKRTVNKTDMYGTPLFEVLDRNLGASLFLLKLNMILDPT